MVKFTPLDKNSKSSKDYLTGFIKLWVPVLLNMGVIFYASSLPVSDIPPLFPFQDIVFHFLIYLILALFFARALRNSRPDTGFSRLVFSTAIFVLFYALSDEFHQSFVPDRFASGFDIFIDTLGGFAGSIIYSWRR